jgi:SAM-dependent methyltransferase
MEQHPGTAAANGRLWGWAADDWATIQEPKCTPIYEAAFDHVDLRIGTKYADLGCGAGTAAHLAAERGAHVSGLDASENLVAIARSRVPHGDFHVGELESIPFANHSFDVVAGFNSFQYAARPHEALREAKRVARPGGRVIIMTWGKPEGMEAAAIVTAVRPLLLPPPPGAPGPFALSDESALRGLATSAGLEPLEIIDVDCSWRYSDLTTALRGLRSSGVAKRAIENSSAEAVDEAHAEVLGSFRQSDGSYKIGARFRGLVARA